MSIKKFIFLWMGGLIFSFAVLALFLVISTDRLQTMSALMLSSNKEIEVAHEFETAVLDERREDLLWRATGRMFHRQQKLQFLQRATEIIGRLEKMESSLGKEQLITEIEQLFAKFTAVTRAEPPAQIDAVSNSTNQLLHAIERFRAANRAQMSETLAQSNDLDKLVDRWSVILIGAVSVMVVIGSFLLINRIVLPISYLSDSARKLGQGHLAMRARVIRNDEFGQLCTTFNEMAENITQLQQGRLNFIASVAHDLKNPLILIGATARRLRKKLSIPTEHMELLDRLIEQVSRMEDLINDLMDSARIDTDQLSLNLEELELQDLLNSIQQHHAHMIISHRILFNADAPCRIRGDARRIERVIDNLLSNAVKYSPRNSEIRMGLARHGEKAVITIADEGIGINPSQISELFQPYKRLHQSQDMAQGTGLGLFSVKKIIEGHGGTIHMDSEPGKGTTITIELPLIHGA